MGTIETLRAIKDYCRNTHCDNCSLKTPCIFAPCSWNEKDIQMIATFKGEDNNNED